MSERLAACFFDNRMTPERLGTRIERYAGGGQKSKKNQNKQVITVRSTDISKFRYIDISALRAVAVFPFLTGMEAHMVDALTPQSDEGRGLAAIRFGEVPGNL